MLRKIIPSAASRRGLFLLALCCLTSLFAHSADQRTSAADASRLNNVGVALMNQQFTEKALAKFEAAHAADPSAAVPLLNAGIAMLYLQKLPEAEDVLQQAAKIDPNNARAWYAMGLAHLNAGNPKLAIEDLQRVVKIDPNDADAHYFMGSFYLSLNDYAHAKEEYEKALALNPIHASAQFGLARALQRSGDVDASRQHLKRFQELTQNKISSPLSAAYGEQGHYATVEDMLAPPVTPGAMIPVTLAAEPLAAGASGNSDAGASGACLLDMKGSGNKDLVLLGSGDRAIRVFESGGDGHFAEIPVHCVRGRRL
jgi:tetratricopeptide (TPR) repeat protein